MKVTLDNGEVWRIEFTHGTRVDRRWTECRISRADPPTWFRGEAICAPGDQFRRETGRKLALARALDLAAIRREVRKRFWEAYLGRKGGAS